MKTLVDIHIHPTMKPFGQAAPGNTNSDDASLRNSIWHDDPPTPRDRRINRSLTVTRFSQSNFTELHLGNFRVVVVSLYPIEKGFFTSRTGSGRIADLLYDFTTGIGIKKVNYIQNNTDDFNELEREYEFLKQLHDTEVTIYGTKVRYMLSGNFNDIKSNLENRGPVISVVLSIEGANLFSNDNSRPPDPAAFLSNIGKVKNWQHPPLFISLCHHFYNYLGGHARSFQGITRLLIDQTPGINTGITPLGSEAIRLLLDKSSGKRILIDIKHMSRQVRKAYYIMLDEEYAGEQIPVIVSHGAVNGYPELDDTGSSGKARNGLFNGEDINFFDDEIIRIARTGGIFGLQTDKRRLTGRRENMKIRLLCFTKKRKFAKWNSFIWNQVRHIADLLDSIGLPAWDNICLGTDYDGIVAPVEGYWTSSDIRHLRRNLVQYADQYLRKKIFINAANNISSEKILNKMFSENALAFLSKYYN